MQYQTTSRHGSNGKTLSSSSVCPATKQSGFSLIEVMVSALVLSVSLLGILGMQLVGMKGTHHSYMKQQAMGVVQNAMERMSANRDGVTNGDYKLDSTSFNCGATAPTCATACDKTQIALIDKLNLVCGYKTSSSSRTGGVKLVSASDNITLPSGKLTIACRQDPVSAVEDCSLGDVTIKVEWQERAIGEEVVQADSLELKLRITAP